MHFSTTTILSTIILASSAFAGPLDSRDSDDSSNPDLNIFPTTADAYENYAICKNKITKDRFPSLAAPSDEGGCVRYYPGIDMTGVVTMIDLFFKDGISNACDCAAACLDRPLTCTNWVFKHTFAGAAIDSNKRSCTLYSSPNIPTDVTLMYHLNGSVGTGVIGMNPQQGGDAPLTFLDVNNTMVDKFGVSGFMSRDTNGLQYC
ncbi:uncharacterized protein LY89DRAFT_786008 [Mollisia scopiformis]|uniref:Apple domain-containing protein n=1 Tax=Mollisia scopiformis TaxID=149040 RepID=A0A194WV29_MOLSC|nr:uncharacterized protein LY89DRAFT_786008 [Mollisia scopiformis]KUJ11828.1 hypothetical protein LY89DRAFT_786008 [Mollisia scopiformis]